MPPVEMLFARDAHRGVVGADRSTIRVSDGEARIAYSLKIAGQIEVDVGAPDNVPGGRGVYRCLAKREPAVKMLVALTFIAASTPIVPPLLWMR